MKKVKEKLLKEMQRRDFMKTSDVVRWGLDNHTNTAGRKARLLANEGKIERLTNDEKIELFGKIKESVWMAI